MWYILIAIIGYFLGNISSSYLVGKLMAKVDVREHGSGNLGATNVYRVLGFKAGAIVFLADTLKGLLATLIGLWIKGDVGGLIGGIAAVAGHNWPFLLEFKGGKGIATSFGSISHTLSPYFSYTFNSRGAGYCLYRLCIPSFNYCSGTISYTGYCFQV